MNVYQLSIEVWTHNLLLDNVRQNVKWTCVLFRRVSRVSLKFAHIYEQLFKAKFQAIFACPVSAIIVKNGK